MAHILIVEDNRPLRHAIMRALQQAGHDVAQAERGRDALHHLHARHVHILLTDMFMSDVDGIEVMQCVRRQFPNTRIIAISGGGLQINHHRSKVSLGILDVASQLGAVATLDKPFTTSDVVAVVHQVLEMADE